MTILEIKNDRTFEMGLILFAPYTKTICPVEMSMFVRTGSSHLLIIHNYILKYNFTDITEKLVNSFLNRYLVEDDSGVKTHLPCLGY